MCPGTIVYISLRPGTLYVPGTLLYHRFLQRCMYNVCVCLCDCLLLRVGSLGVIRSGRDLGQWVLPLRGTRTGAAVWSGVDSYTSYR
jgi:hypothetical protein